jgi:hypothetical protein
VETDPFTHVPSKLEAANETYADSPYFAICINPVWSKLDDYHKNSDDSNVYLVASILDPPIKLRYFEKTLAAGVVGRLVG